MVTNAMVAQGYQPATSPQAATMIVQLGYGVDDGKTRIVEDPLGYRDPFFGSPYWSRWGYYGRYRSPFYYGWDDPFWYSPFDRPIRSYIEYKSQLSLDIRRRSDNASLFEGKAVARSTNDNLGVLVPNLITAMFTGFPGHSGEMVRITVPPEQKVKG